ncbi:MAG: hypothetical protein ACXAD7_27535 [Candidatus Kariarchaeaceae archaeon]|jgi:hypothetical protein
MKTNNSNFLFAIGGMVANIIYGPKETTEGEEGIGMQKDRDRYCPSWASKYDQGSKFCLESGILIEIAVK